MYTFPTRVRIQDLVEEISAIPLVRIPDGSGSSHFDGPERWIRGLSNTRVHLGDTYPWLTQAVCQLRDHVGGTVVQIMVNRLEPGAELSEHRDGLPDNARYHLPIVTHDLAFWWDELEGRRHMMRGWWYGPVPYCGVLHMAGNPSPIARTHLVVDLTRERDAA